MITRIMEKLDEHLSKNDYAAAERHLLYWSAEAEAQKNPRIALGVSNELMGLYRKLGKKQQAFDFARKALEKLEELEMTDCVGAATTYINVATVYKAFSKAAEGMPYFEKAKAIYEEILEETDPRLGGLYNNMALALGDLKRFEEAKATFQKALQVMEKVPDGEPEMAITYLNMASAAEAEKGLEEGEEEIGKFVAKAMELLDKNSHRKDGNYAFVCEKCASVFGYYGYFLYENELKERSRRIYERT